MSSKLCCLFLVSVVLAQEDTRNSIEEAHFGGIINYQTCATTEEYLKEIKKCQLDEWETDDKSNYYYEDQCETLGCLASVMDEHGNNHCRHNLNLYVLKRRRELKKLAKTNNAFFPKTCSAMGLDSPALFFILPLSLVNMMFL